MGAGCFCQETSSESIAAEDSQIKQVSHSSVMRYHIFWMFFSAILKNIFFALLTVFEMIYIYLMFNVAINALFKTSLHINLVPTTPS